MKRGGETKVVSFLGHDMVLETARLEKSDKEDSVDVELAGGSPVCARTMLYDKDDWNAFNKTETIDELVGEQLGSYLYWHKAIASHHKLVKQYEEGKLKTDFFC